MEKEKELKDTIKELKHLIEKWKKSLKSLIENLERKQKSD